MGCPQLVLLLADERRAVRAMTFLLADWGYRVAAGRIADEVVLPESERAIRPIAIISDMVRSALYTSLNEALALRAKFANDIPILICTQTAHVPIPKPLADVVTVLVKPVDPDWTCKWLESVAATRAID